MYLFAQVQPKNDPDFEDIDPELMPFFIAFVCVFVLIVLVVFICFLLSMSKALSRCRRRNRSMEPGMVWLNLIPCLNIVWQFVTAIRVSESLKNEFNDRGWAERGDFGKGVGLAAICLNIAGNVVGKFPVPVLEVGFGLASLVCFIVYWVKVARYSRELADDGGRGRDDDDDDRPRNHRARDDDDDDRR